eukprot:6002922-Pleurochrysis_carterae.AAC.1
MQQRGGASVSWAGGSKRLGETGAGLVRDDGRGLSTTRVEGESWRIAKSGRPMRVWTRGLAAIGCRWIRVCARARECVSA